MTDPKPWWTSRSVWGALITIGLSVAGIFIDVSAIDAGELTDVLVALSTGIAGLLALWGTITRQAPIDPTLVAPGVRRPTRRARADGSERMQPDAVSPRADATEARNPSRFPDGPFFGNS